MAFDPFKRYFKLNLAILIAGGLALALAGGHSLLSASGVDPLGQVMGSWSRANAGRPEGEARLRSELMAARARIVELQDELYLVSAELRNREAHPGVSLALRDRVPARVVRTRDLSPLRRAFSIDRGSEAGIREGMPVTCLGWLVGVIRQVRAYSATVVTVADTSFSAEVRLGAPIGAAAVPEGQEAGRPRGIYVGLGGLGGEGEVVYVTAPGRTGTSGIQRESVVYTAGSDLVPAGMPIGLVSEVKGGQQGLFLDIRVAPAFDLSWVELVQVEAASGQLQPRASAAERR